METGEGDHDMRYGDRIIFRVGTREEVYDPDIGEFVPGEFKEDIVPADVNDLGITKAVEVFGGFRKGRKIARLQRPYNRSFSEAVYKGKSYIAVADRLDSTVFYLEEDGLHGS